MPVLPALDGESWRRLERLARRVSRRADEAEDLVQDVLLAALEAGRSDDAWLHGTMRRRAAFLARGAVRRARREAVAAGAMPDATEADTPAGHHGPGGAGGIALLLARLPPAARRVLLLALHGMGAGEIQWLLRTTPTAFRQRLATIRREFRRLPPEIRAGIVADGSSTARARPLDPHFGLRRRVLVAAGAGTSSAGSHDPDGHLLLFRRREPARLAQERTPA
jgi:DNA-directed RNA polymerase specialized sigma24 family protein